MNKAIVNGLVFVASLVGSAAFAVIVEKKRKYKPLLVTQEEHSDIVDFLFEKKRERERIERLRKEAQDIGWKIVLQREEAREMQAFDNRIVDSIERARRKHDQQKAERGANGTHYQGGATRNQQPET